MRVNQKMEHIEFD